MLKTAVWTGSIVNVSAIKPLSAQSLPVRIVATARVQ
jgi:hypothetical protein